MTVYNLFLAVDDILDDVVKILCGFKRKNVVRRVFVVGIPELTHVSGHMWKLLKAIGHVPEFHFNGFQRIACRCGCFLGHADMETEFPNRLRKQTKEICCGGDRGKAAQSRDNRAHYGNSHNTTFFVPHRRLHVKLVK